LNIFKEKNNENITL